MNESPLETKEQIEREIRELEMEKLELEKRKSMLSAGWVGLFMFLAYFTIGWTLIFGGEKIAGAIVLGAAGNMYVLNNIFMKIKS